MKKNKLSAAISLSLGVAAISITATATAAVTTYNWSGMSIWLDAQGGPLSNTSAAKGANPFQSPVTGVMMFDDTTGAGTGYVNTYEFLSATMPAQAHDMSLQAIGDGAGGVGTLIVGNMLLNWDGVNDISVSMVWDAAGFFGATTSAWTDGVLDQADVAAYGAVPASDGTYTDGRWGYMNQGPLPIATTAFDTTNLTGCEPGIDTNFANNTGGGCMGIALSGGLPLITDAATNINDYDLDAAPTSGGFQPLANEGIGGSPMQDGPFRSLSLTYEIITMTVVDNPGAPETIATFCGVDTTGDLCAMPATVPVPAAVWLFGSGLLGLIGMGRRKQKAMSPTT